MPENPRIEELRRRVEADPASIAFAALAEEYRRLGRCDEAIETCLAGLQRHPAYLSARVTLGRALLENADLESAREQFEIVLRAAPENIAATRGLAQIHERLGHVAEMDPHLAQLMREHAETMARAEPPAPGTPTPAAIPEPDSDLAGLVDLQPAEPAGAAPPLELQVLELASLDPAPIDPEPPALEFPVPQLSIPELPTLRTLDRSEPPDAGERTAPFADVPVAPPVALTHLGAGAPDPAVVAALAGLEQFLSAIQHARHA
jgi:tetratricopeptide (TPR) repeat protein